MQCWHNCLSFRKLCNGSLLPICWPWDECATDACEVDFHHRLQLRSVWHSFCDHNLSFSSKSSFFEAFFEAFTVSKAFSMSSIFLIKLMYKKLGSWSWMDVLNKNTGITWNFVFCLKIFFFSIDCFASKIMKWIGKQELRPHFRFRSCRTCCV